MEFRDYYQILGVSRDASDDEIRKAFRKLARKFHPDVAEDKEEGERRFKEINEAYEVLGDREKRKKYDSLGARWRDFEGVGSRGPSAGGMDFSEFFAREQPGGSQEFHFGGTGFSDFFEQFFGMGSHGPGGMAGGPGGMAGRAGGMRRQPAARGQDIEADLLVTLDEACHGSTRKLQLQGADGKLSSVTVRIPKGIQEGQSLRVRGHGRPGQQENGDLFLHIRFERHPIFKADGINLVGRLELAPWEAVLGTKVEMATPRGRVRLSVPPGTNDGEELIARGMGMPDGKGNNGDLRAVVGIVVPTEISENERRVWQELEKISNFNPRP